MLNKTQTDALEVVKTLIDDKKCDGRSAILLMCAILGHDIVDEPSQKESEPPLKHIGNEDIQGGSPIVIDRREDWASHVILTGPEDHSNRIERIDSSEPLREWYHGTTADTFDNNVTYTASPQENR